MRVRVPPLAPLNKSTNTAYVIGVAIGDGNLSNPNGRATRLRVTCDNKYPELQKRIIESLKFLLPKNKVNCVFRTENCTDISCYSNKLESILGWKANNGSKFMQNVRIPSWIYSDQDYVRNCLRGLFETDGSIYLDRKYLYVNFTTIIYDLAKEVLKMIVMLGYQAKIQTSQPKIGQRKYVVRVCKRSREFIKDMSIEKI